VPAPFIEELPSPSGRVVIPELLKGFLEKIRSDALQVVTKEVAEGDLCVVVRFFWRLSKSQRDFFRTG